MQKTFYVQILQKKKATLIILTLKTKEDVTIHSTSIFDLKNLILYCFEIPRKRPNERKRVRIGANDILVILNMEFATPRYKKQYIIKF